MGRDEKKGKTVHIDLGGCGGCCGCLFLIITGYLFWALVFGVTWAGTHHSISCSQENGVEIR